MLAGLLSSGFTFSAYADELIMVTGQRVPGIVLAEVQDGVWIEVAPWAAAFFPYDRVVRAEKWTAERNAALFDHGTKPPPLPRTFLSGTRVLDTPQGVWIEVKPRVARLVPREQLAELPADEAFVEDASLEETADATAPAAEAPHRLVSREEAVLRTWSDQPEPLSPAQVARKVGQPDERQRSGRNQTWLYALSDDATAYVYFRDGRLDYVDILIPQPDDDANAAEDDGEESAESAR